MKKQLLINVLLIVVMLLMAACGVTGKTVVPTQPGQQVVSDRTPVEYYPIDETLSTELVSIDTQAAEMGISDNDVVSIIVNLGGVSLYEQYLDDGSAQSIAAYAASDRGVEVLGEIARIQDEFENSVAGLGIELEYKYRYSALTTAVAVSTAYRNVARLQKLDIVKGLAMDTQYATPDVAVSVASLLTETGVYANDTEFDGTGRVISVIDTGLDWKHEAFTVMPSVSQIGLSDVEDLISLFSFNSALRYQASDLYINGKVGFGYDYADRDTDVIPSEIGVLQASGYHGTHVAGTAAGNAESGFKGVAYNAQLVIMKVFGDNGGGGYMSDIVAAASDAMLLGADTINMSLGSPLGFTYEASESQLFINEIYEIIDRAGVSIVASAGNAYNTGLRSTSGANYTSNPDIGTIGSPGSYTTSFAVASVEKNKTPYLLSGDGRQIFFDEAVDAASYYMDFLGDFYAKNPEGTYDYVVVPGNGEEADYEGLDLNGKIALVKRGGTTFVSKALNAANHGAVAVIIYNNQEGTIAMSMTEQVGIAICSISMVDGEALANANVKTINISKANGVGPYMSDFSSWGVLTDLTIKPEITGFGGDITAPVPETYGKLYETMSGTSMSSPNVAGVATVVRQYLRERYPSYTNKQIQNLTYQLLMSTAANVLDEAGNPSFVRKQGAGLANLSNAVNTKAYLSVTGSNRTKIELGDDPDESGIYTLRFNLVNISEDVLSYTFNTLTFTESVADNGYNVAYLAYMLDKGNVEITVKNGTLEGDKITVEGNATASIKVKITLAEEEKEYIRDNFENGYYVEGFVQLLSENEDGIDLSIPWLAFFGDFTKAPILENSIFDEDQTTHFGLVMPLLNYGTNQAIVAGQYPFNLPEGAEPVETSEDNIATSIFTSTTNGIYSVYLYTLRGIKYLEYVLTDDITGEILWSGYAYNVKKTFYYPNTGKVVYTSHNLNINPYELGFANNQTVRMTVKATLDFYREKVEEFSFPVYVDFEKPQIADDEAVDTYVKDGRAYLEVPLYDNHKVMNYGLYTLDEANNAVGDALSGWIPARNWVKGENNTVVIDITDYLGKLKELGSSTIVVYVNDWALNAAAWGFNVKKSMDELEAPEEGDEGANSLNKNNNNGSDKVVVMSENGDFVVENGVLTDYLGTNPEVIIPGDIGITELRKGLFDGNKWITKVVVPEGVTVIGGNCFRRCASLEELILPESLVDLGYYALSYLSSLKEVIIPENVEAYGYCMFMGSTGLEKIIFKSNKIINGESFAFYGCTSLKEIQLPESLESFDYGAFRGCTSLTSLTFPASFKAFTGAQALYGMTSLQSLVFKGEIPATLNKNTFDRGNALRHIYVPEGCAEAYKTAWAEVADQIHEISEFDIDENGVLNVNGYTGSDDYMVIPDGVKAVKEGAFKGNERITGVFMPISLETIGNRAFGGAVRLSVAYISENVTEIPEMAFADTALESVVIPKNVVKIGDYAFSGCKKLNKIQIMNRIPAALGTDVFENLPEGCEFIVPEKTLDLYKEAWASLAEKYTMVEVNPFVIDENGVLKKYLGIGGDIVIPEGVKEIAANAFASNSVITGVEIASTVVKIGEKAFYNMVNIQKVSMPDSVVEMGQYVFSGCVNLVDVGWSKGLTQIPMGTFENCAKLKDFEIPSWVTALDHYAFFGTGFVNLVVPESVTSIGMFCWMGSEKVETLEVYGNITTEFNQAFAKFYALKWAKFYGSVQSFTGYDFAESRLCEEVIFYGDVLGSIKNWTFNKMFSLKKVEFFGHVNSIGGVSFNNCTELTDVIFHKSFGGLDTIETRAGAFAGCTKLTHFSVSEDNEYLTVDEYGVLYNKDMTEVYVQPHAWDYDGVYVMPDTVTYVPDLAFSGMEYLTTNFEYTLGGGWTATISANYSYKPLLKGVKLSKNLEYIGAKAFIGLHDITTYEMIDGKITKVVKESGFANLEGVEFGENTNGTQLYIGEYAFAYNSGVKDLKMPSNLVEVGSYAFANCGFEELVLPEGFESLAPMSFGNNTALKSVTIPSTMLPDNFSAAFVGCTNLSNYIISENNPYFILEDEFVLNAAKTVVYSYVGDATELVIPEGVVYIAANAFLNNEHLVKVTMPSTLKAVGDKAFFGIATLEEVVFLGDKAPVLYCLYDASYENYKMMYQNFVDFIYNLNRVLRIVHKADSSYESLLWKTYFTEHYLLLEDGSVVPEYTKETEEENDANALNESVAAPSAIRRNGFEDNAVVFAVIDVAENGKYGKLASEAVSDRVVHIPSNVCVY